MKQRTPSPETILGIDPGTVVTGYGILRAAPGGTIQVLDFGCIKPPKKASFPERMAFIFNGLEEILAIHPITGVSIETQFVYHNVSTAMKLGMARGIALLAAARKGVSVYEYAPTRAKQAILGKGSASKEQVQKMVQILLRLPSPPEPQDAADALALALCHLHQIRKGTYQKTNIRGQVPCMTI